MLIILGSYIDVKIMIQVTELRKFNLRGADDDAAVLHLALAVALAESLHLSSVCLKPSIYSIIYDL